MKKLTTISLAIGTSLTAFASEKVIKCTGPVGGQISRIEGKIQLTPALSGQMQATGIVRLNDGKSFQVQGVYDKVGGIEYSTLAPSKRSSIKVIYVNFGDSSKEANSYFEIGQKTFPLNCGKN